MTEPRPRWKHCPDCGRRDTNNGEAGGGPTCWHCDVCGFVECDSLVMNHADAREMAQHTALRALVEQWRAKVDEIVYADGKHITERCSGYVDCADALATLLGDAHA